MRAPQGGLIGWFAQNLMVKFNSISSIEIINRLQLDTLGDGDSSLSVVELGPGNGFSMTELIASKKCKTIHGVEISQRFRDLLGDKFKADIDSGLLSIHDNDAKDLSFLEDSSIDAIYALNVIYFLNPLEEYLTELRRVCKPDAKVIFGVCDTVKRNDEVVFVNQDWDVCMDKMKDAGFSNVEISEEIACGDMNFYFISSLAGKTGNTMN
eukprot:CAMPEP_0198126648 /NCGR_PEP_ID=MMETSP1442-20131203/45351_1 /TAXON_ID= /ORGANISM="Craspedostauros australis, Strain CCMP3328" /LENGTH=209 /DNA_ID=CAMNT_0043786473 /DNA_START=292 /DNA_END=921 /DNA_ORIENTATION=+